MCQAECFGYQYRTCNHYVRIYYSGETKDCEINSCRLSKRHVHGESKTCGCRDYYDDYERVIDILQALCPECARGQRRT